MLTLLLGLMLQTAPVALPRSEIDGADPRVLAGKILSPEIATSITGGWVRRQFIPGTTYAAGFWGEPVSYRPRLCSRPGYSVTFTTHDRVAAVAENPILTAGEIQQGIGYALAAPGGCNEAKGWISVSPTNTEASLRMLIRLGEAIEAAKGRHRLPFDIQCTSETPGSCRDRRAALAGLPMASLLSIRVQNTVYREEPAQNGVQVRYMQPVKDGRWPQAEVSFGPSDPDGRSWTLLLKGADRLETVEMRRTTIIRH